jgi:LL-diaminopimelate aminotransferase
LYLHEEECQMKNPARIDQLPAYIFAEIDRLQEAAIREGRDIISLGVGDPDQPTPDVIVQQLQRLAAQAEHHQYPPYVGIRDFRQAVAEWYQARFAVELDPDEEVLALIGSKEGIAHLSLGWAGPGDVVLVPDPGYPVYRISAIFAGAESYLLPLRPENDFLPDFSLVPAEVCQRATLLYLNYPNNPTGATVDLDFFEEAVAFARRHQLVLAHDLAYSEVAFDGYRPPSVLQIPGAKDVAIEFNSLSKTYNMTGWRLGMAVGGRRLLENLRRIKVNVDSSQFGAIQAAGAYALRHVHDPVRQQAALYQERRDLLVAGLRACRLSPHVPRASFYVWTPVPAGYTSMEFAMHMLREIGVVVVPGIGFGEHGEGYIRFSLTVNDARLREAVERIRRLRW